MQNLESTTEVQNAESTGILRYAVRLLEALAKIRERFTPNAILEIRGVFREAGFRGILKRYGWKLIAAFFAYYLIRDISLYILLPYLITKGIF